MTGLSAFSSVEHSTSGGKLRISPEGLTLPLFVRGKAERASVPADLFRPSELPPLGDRRFLLIDWLHRDVFGPDESCADLHSVPVIRCPDS